MGYVRVAYRKIFEELDSNDSMSKGWDKFVEKHAEYQNLIIRSSKNRCHCTNCNHDFISKKKVGEIAKCPNCKNKYLVKRSNLKWYEFKDYLSILDYINDTFVIRYFELKSTIGPTHKHSYSVAEFGREIPMENLYPEVYVNGRVSRTQCHIYIYHGNGWYVNDKQWRQYTRRYSLIDNSIVFPNNLKKLLQNTEYKYSCLWDIAKNCSYINLTELLKNKEEHSLKRIELLAKMKLYNLIPDARYFSCSGTFQSIFGVPKDYYEFMKRNNITYRQLRLLKLLQEKDISKIKYLEKFANYWGNIDSIEEISEYISLNRFIKYAKMHHGKVKTYLYKDYLRFAKALGYDLKNNRYAFPANLPKEHDKLQELYRINSEKLIQDGIKKRGKELAINKYQDKVFVIIPADSLKSLQNESEQQSNCVKTYAEKYAQGKCDIYFMRNVDKPKKSLVTVEVKNNRVVQSRTKYNHNPNEEQLKFLANWEQKVLKGAA